MLAGWAREQVCTYMCPWPRFQAAMLDEQSVIVTYQKWRGEPRGKHKAGDSWEGRGDCVDCNLCVAVCPTGIDIRDGQQIECIGCGLCIDACNEIMEQGRPPARPDPLGHAGPTSRPRNAAARRPVAAAAAAHPALRGAARRRRRRDAGGFRTAQRRRAHRPARPQPEFRAAVATATSATPTPSRS